MQSSPVRRGFDAKYGFEFQLKGLRLIFEAGQALLVSHHKTEFLQLSAYQDCVRYSLY